MSRKLLRRLLIMSAALVPGMAAGGAFAQDAPPADKISGLAGVTFASDYNSRGLLLENQGFIAQPYGELQLLILEGADGPVNNLSLFGGVWSSLHSEHTTASPDTTVPAWYEFDWYLGASADWGNFNTTLSYWEFISPNDSFATARNFELKVAYNDAEMWADSSLTDFGIRPYGKIFVETAGKAGTGSDRGVYVELGVAPGWTVNGESDYPIALSFPIAVGLGFSDFYGDDTGDDETYGFTSVGVAASVPLKFMSDYGAWTMTAGVYFYHFGPGVDWFNDATVGGDKEYDIVGSLGFSVAF
jgi:hypothetical protein